VIGELDRGLKLFCLDFNGVLSFAKDGRRLGAGLTAATFFNVESTRLITFNIRTALSTRFISTASCPPASSLLLPVEELLRPAFVASVSILTLWRTPLGVMLISIGKTFAGKA
jgi:hypothetical protein